MSTKLSGQNARSSACGYLWTSTTRSCVTAAKPPIIGDVLALLRRQQLGDIRGLGPLRIREITAALTVAGFSLGPEGATARPDEHEGVTEECPISCLRLSTRAHNALTYDPSNPKTIGDVLRLLERRQIQDIRGLGPQRIDEITAALVLAGFSIRQDHGFCGGDA